MGTDGPRGVTLLKPREARPWHSPNNPCTHLGGPGCPEGAPNTQRSKASLIIRRGYRYPRDQQLLLSVVFSLLFSTIDFNKQCAGSKDYGFDVPSGTPDINERLFTEPLRTPDPIDLSIPHYQTTVMVDSS
jgi:hypothetical protein